MVALSCLLHVPPVVLDIILFLPQGVVFMGTHQVRKKTKGKTLKEREREGIGWMICITFVLMMIDRKIVVVPLYLFTGGWSHTSYDRGVSYSCCMVSKRQHEYERSEIFNHCIETLPFKGQGMKSLA